MDHETLEIHPIRIKGEVSLLAFYDAVMVSKMFDVVAHYYSLVLRVETIHLGNEI